MHLAQSFLKRAPIGNRLLEPLILLLGQGDANGLAFDFARPRITGTPGSRPPSLNVAFANPLGPGQLRPESGILLLGTMRLFFVDS